MSDDDNNQRRRWHVGKEIPIATIFVLVAQTLGAIWWAATISAKVDAHEKADATAGVIQLATDKRQDEERERAENRILVQFDKINAKIDLLMVKSR